MDGLSPEATCSRAVRILLLQLADAVEAEYQQPTGRKNKMIDTAALDSPAAIADRTTYRRNDLRRLVWTTGAFPAATTDAAAETNHATVAHHGAMIDRLSGRRWTRRHLSVVRRNGAGAADRARRGGVDVAARGLGRIIEVGGRRRRRHRGMRDPVVGSGGMRMGMRRGVLKGRRGGGVEGRVDLGGFLFVVYHGM